MARGFLDGGHDVQVEAGGAWEVEGPEFDIPSEGREERDIARKLVQFHDDQIRARGPAVGQPGAILTRVFLNKNSTIRSVYMSI